jgi:23S rRNA (uracil1939-C5)-methyltransferase
VAALTHEGEGIVRGGKTAFVAGALPGEQISFVRTRRHRQHDEGRLLEVIAPAPERVVPRCAHFGVCGGCALQHLTPEAQLAAKQAELRDNLERIAHALPDTWFEPIRSPPWNYRRRARLGAKYVAKKGRVVVGFRERLAPYVAALDRCEVLAAPVGELIEPLSGLLTGLSIRERLPQIEVAVADNATALVLRVLVPPSESDLAALRAFEVTHGVRFYLQSGGVETVTPLTSGHPPLVYRHPRQDVELEFSPTDFVQVNGPVNTLLVERALELLDPGPDSSVLDLFCGLGNFTLALARRAGLVRRAEANALQNGIRNVEFHVADLAKEASDLPAWAARGYSHVLLDPPRAGAREMLPTVARLRPKAVLYISCHPGSLARDIGMLVETYGFALRAAGVVDMFPHTTHVESLALLTPSTP